MFEPTCPLWWLLSTPGAQGIGGPEVHITYGDSYITGVTGRAPIRLNGTFINGSAGSSSGGQRGSLSFSQGIVAASSVQGGARSASSGGRAPWDGLLGMGRPALAVGWLQPPMISLVEQGLLAEPVFGLWLSHDPSGPGKGGELALGGWNPARMQGDVHW